MSRVSARAAELAVGFLRKVQNEMLQEGPEVGPAPRAESAREWWQGLGPLASRPQSPPPLLYVLCNCFSVRGLHNFKS